MTGEANRDPAPAPRASKPARGGRPSREDAEKLREQILAVATEMFLDRGYGATSIDAVASQARMSKRTFYHRFPDKAALFAAVVRDLVGRMRPVSSDDAAGLAALFGGAPLPAILLRLGHLALKAALQPQAIALQRVIVSEAPRFPELAASALSEGSRQQAIDLLAGLLDRESRAGRISVEDPFFAGEQFLQMLISVPQRRAMGLGTPMNEAELAPWVEKTVQLFLQGCRFGVTASR